MSNQPRKPKGTPVGGQFDRTAGGGPATILENNNSPSPFASQIERMDNMLRIGGPGGPIKRVELGTGVTLERIKNSDSTVYNVMSNDGVLTVHYLVPRDNPNQVKFRAFDDGNMKDKKLINAHLREATDGQVQVSNKGQKRILVTPEGEYHYSSRFNLYSVGRLEYGVPSTEGYFKGTMAEGRWK